MTVVALLCVSTGLHVLLNSSILMVLETTGLGKLIPWNVPVVAASLDVCDPFFFRAEDSLLTVGRFVDGLSVTWVHRPDLQRGRQIEYPANGKRIQTWRALGCVSGVEGVLTQKQTAKLGCGIPNRVHTCVLSVGCFLRECKSQHSVPL